MIHQSSLIIYIIDDPIVSSIPSCFERRKKFKVAWESMLEKEKFPSLTSLHRARSARRWGWERQGVGSKDWGYGDDPSSASSFLSNGPSLQLTCCWSIKARPGRVIFVTWRGRRCGFILTSASFATWLQLSQVLTCSASQSWVFAPRAHVFRQRGEKNYPFEGKVGERESHIKQPARVKFGLAPICKRFKNTPGPFSAFALFYRAAYPISKQPCVKVLPLTLLYLLRVLISVLSEGFRGSRNAC